MEIKEILQESSERVTAYLQNYMQQADCMAPNFPSQLTAAAEYSLFAGGKRLRPALVLLTAELLGIDAVLVLPIAGAIEMIHTYSLIHDDLPAMDNDDLRRGKPTCHIKYGEALAILAGDALLTEAFVMLSTLKLAPAHVVRIVRDLGRGAGFCGMVAGQAADMHAEHRQIDADELAFIHANKTGRLLECSVLLPAMAASAGAEYMDALSVYGKSFGLAFQITDDILDETADEAELGKPVGSDRKQEKSTFVSLYGLDGARALAAEQVDLAVQALAVFPEQRRQKLELLVRYCLERKK